MKIVFASGNPNKIIEIKKMLPAGVELLGLEEVGITEEVPENQNTIEGNALEKAEYVFHKTGLPCFADDTGLEVFSLMGEPGVLSARYAGEEKDADKNMDKLLKKLEGESSRDARFKTVIALATNSEAKVFEGIVEGKIGRKKVGHGGFGYDPIFYPEGREKTFAEMTMEEKNQLSHRARALKKLIAYLEKSYS